MRNTWHQIVVPSVGREGDERGYVGAIEGLGHIPFFLKWVMGTQGFFILLSIYLVNTIFFFDPPIPSSASSIPPSSYHAVVCVCEGYFLLSYLIFFTQPRTPLLSGRCRSVLYNFIVFLIYLLFDNKPVPFGRKINMVEGISQSIVGVGERKRKKTPFSRPGRKMKNRGRVVLITALKSSLRTT